MSARDTLPLEATADQILAHASERAQRMSLRYAGAVTPAEAHRLREAGAATIVDVRTPVEYQQVGHVPGTPLIVWPRNGTREELQAFLDELRAKYEPTERLLFLCRSGVRSHYAAELAAHAGYEGAYNVLEGFEGEYGAGTNGWRAAGLPWQQGISPQPDR